ncbi:hypothetical protein FACS189430_05450 [Bacteroidia bacterium]|nr:hypothetical protein FACS189430_05450 [Bacteroidia bacterium]
MKKLNSEMFRKFGIAALTAAVFVCTPACNKDDDDNGGSPVSSINATVENGASYNSKVDSVKAPTYNGKWVIIAKGKYAEGKFQMDLPATVPAECLRTMFDMAGVNVSNKNVKRFTIPQFSAYKEGKAIGYFSYTNADKTVEVLYWFVDADVTVKGSHTEDDGDTENYDLNLKKGWNEVYYTWTESKDGIDTGSYSNSKPSGLKWFFYEPENYSPKGNPARASKAFLKK